MKRYELGDGVRLEAARDCHGEPRLLRLDDGNGLPETVARAVSSLATPVSLGPEFYWVDVPHQFRIYHVNQSTLRIVFRRRAAREHALEMLTLLREAYQQAGRIIENFCPPELEEVLKQWDNEVIRS